MEYNSSYTEDDLGQTCEINSTVVIELVPYFCSILTLSLVDKAFTDSKESYITVKSHKAGLRTGKLDHYLKVPRPLIFWFVENKKGSSRNRLNGQFCNLLGITFILNMFSMEKLAFRVLR